MNPLKFHFLFIISVIMAGCRNNIPSDVDAIIKSTKNENELRKFVSHYVDLNDSLKLKAAYFLIRNLDDQFFYEGATVDIYRSLFNKLDSIVKTGAGTPRKIWDSLIVKAEVNDNLLKKTKDIDVITSDLLINNVENAFKAWNFPWARQLSFEQFCKYILPYKLKYERPENWRKAMINRYKWIIDSLKDKTNVREAVSLINNDLAKWFYVNPKFGCPADLNCSDLVKIKVGRCFEATQMTAYAMRAMGIPVTLDYTPHWANKGGRHSWNSLIYKNSAIIFMGVETNPGLEKIENSGYNFMGAVGMKRKRAKIFRYCFEKVYNDINKSGQKNIPDHLSYTHLEDVTEKVEPVSDVSVKLDIKPGNETFAYLSVFNNKIWKPIYWGKISSENKVLFTNMGRDIVYLPMVNRGDQLIPASWPFILLKNGEIKVLHPDLQKRHTDTIYKKYPEDNSNKIIPGFNYEVYYWNNEWKSLGIQKADKDYLVYNNIPGNALLFIRNLDTGFQERIFTIENGKQVWW